MISRCTLNCFCLTVMSITVHFGTRKAMCGVARRLNPNNPTVGLLILILKCKLAPHRLDSSGKPMLEHCMQPAICAPSQVPWDKGPCYTSRFSHISPAISHRSRSPITLFHWYLPLQWIWACADLSICPCCPDCIRVLRLIALYHIETAGQAQIQGQILYSLLQVVHWNNAVYLELQFCLLLFVALHALCNGY